ncbi:fasciclin-like arabinogalactan protein 19 [Punica granatum]|uniref:Uncharacterized protein n=2 Tax=Punica granatum TaxID=22663 RepID=A0A2I0IPT2_PUNGR|nr:fasciclin-like arabinogalactan protein 19 [Punica granatum]PKI46002.1 hypothetical protein CRG98_033642 [Punica granatum]
MASDAAINGELLVRAFHAKLLLVLLLLPSRGASIPTSEMDLLLAALRSRGYNLMGNAIATSDLQFDLLSTPSFTLFALPDYSLFALDMALPSSSYVSALCIHAVPRRLSATYLRRLSLLPSSNPLPTLLTGRSLSVGLSNQSHGTIPRSIAVSMDGIELTAPGVYYSRHVAVHGLRRSLPIQPQDSQSVPSGPPHAHTRHSRQRPSKPSTNAQKQSDLITPSSHSPLFPPAPTFPPHPAHLPTSVQPPAPAPESMSARTLETNVKVSPVPSPVIRAHWEQLPRSPMANGVLWANIEDRTFQPMAPLMKGSNVGDQTVEEFEGGHIHVLKRHSGWSLEIPVGLQS